jgi:WD40 repeat protein
LDTALFIADPLSALAHVRRVFSDSSVLASGGKDQLVNIFDLRQSSPLVHRLDGLHAHAVNTVAWHPLNPYQLLSSSIDCRIQLLDLRSCTRGPLYTLRQHFPPSITKAATMFHPIYACHGQFILTASSSNNITMYSSATGELLRSMPVGYSSQQVRRMTRMQLLVLLLSTILMSLRRFLCFCV